MCLFTCTHKLITALLLMLPAVHCSDDDSPNGPNGFDRNSAIGNWVLFQEVYSWDYGAEGTGEETIAGLESAGPRVMAGVAHPDRATPAEIAERSHATHVS